MLNNTEYKSESSERQEKIEDRVFVKLDVANKPAANTACFDQEKSNERSFRRERRHNRGIGSATSGWRVSLW
jgi:hypothetical protein